MQPATIATATPTPSSAAAASDRIALRHHDQSLSGLSASLHCHTTVLCADVDAAGSAVQDVVARTPCK